MAAKQLQRDLVGRLAVMLPDVSNKRGDVIRAGEEVEIGSSYRMWRYGVSPVPDDGRYVIKVHKRCFRIISTEPNHD